MRQHADVQRLARRDHGFSIAELMIAMVISLLMLVALVGIFVNSSRSQTEMTKTNGVIEGGRAAMQILQDDIVHAGFWGGYLPGFDDLTYPAVPGDAPDAIPNPCLEYAAWGGAYRTNVLGIPVQTSDALPSGAGCLGSLPHRAGTDVLIVRHAETCVPGVGNCEADVAGRLYFQHSFCAAEKNAGTAQFATSNSITLAPSAATTAGLYAGVTIRTVSGTGAGQYRSISAYNGLTRVATIIEPWATIPDGTTTYAFEYAFGTTSFPLHRRNCVGTGSPATLPITAGTLAEKRRYESHIYYITDVAHPERAGEVIPTLVRSRLDLDATLGTVVQLAPEALIEGIEGFRVELGIDNVSDSGDPVNYAEAVNWETAAKISPMNRGDGSPDLFVRCTAAAPCSVADLSNVVAVKLYLLARSRDRTPGHSDTKTYCLGEPNSDGTCPVASTIAVDDDYKRHAFTTSVRLTNVSGRRETPP